MARNRDLNTKMPTVTLPDDPDDLLRQHQAIRRRLPHTWNAFFARFGRLRPIQLAAVPEVLTGSSVLITAPTAGGKTEAVAAPLCERLKQGGWGGMSIVMVTPTRALVNDLFHRLEKPCQAIGVTLARKTSDHALPEKETPQFVITTPESLESLLTFNRERLAGLRAMVIDEIHLLDGTARGDQLRFMLRRLEAYLRFKQGESGYSLQRLAVSATVPHPAETAAGYLGEKPTLVTVPGQRAVESKIIVVPGDDQTRAREAMLATESFDDVRKALVFVNSRRQADLAGQYQYGNFAHAPIYGHHGNLSKHRRESTEMRFKSDRQAVCLATMTLEVGIDIGDVDLVVCMDPPFSLGSFLQRIGRGCRRRQGQTRVLCVARDSASRLIFEALVEQAVAGMPPTPRPPVRRSVLVQQTLAYLRQVDRHSRTEEQLRRMFSLSVRPEFPVERVAEVTRSMGETGLLRIQNGVAEPGPEGWGFIESQSIYSNIASSVSDMALVDADTGKRLANVRGLEAGAEGVQVAGRSYVVVGNASARIRKVRGTTEEQPAPTYAARSLPYSADVGIALARRLGIAATELVILKISDKLAAFTWLGRLQNLSLEGLLARAGVAAKAASFCLHFRGVDAPDCLEKLRLAVAGGFNENPLPDLPVERVADLGPYFDLLPDGEQRRARADWFQAQVLRDFIAGLERVRLVGTDDLLRADLTSLAAL